MIELDKIIIKDKFSIVEARNKIHMLAYDLDFNSIETVRLATITSELCRLIYQDDKETDLVVGFEKLLMHKKNEKSYCLILIFNSKKTNLDIKRANNFFNVLEKYTSKNGYITIKAVTYLPNPNFNPTKEFIERKKEKLLQVSKRGLFDEVKQKNKELLQILDERNNAFNDLKEKNKELKLATKLKSEFLANMSHELRTPLNSIIGFTHRVIKKATANLPEKQVENLKRVEKNAHHLLGLINSVLDISKIEAGKMDVFLEEFILNQLIFEVIDLTMPLVSEKNLTIDTNLSENQLVLNTDKTKLKQILINLISNATKFTESGTITISAKKLTKNQIENDIFFKPDINYISISVIDTGTGMSKDESEYIFDAFRQVDGSTTRKAGGTGLGLSITKEFTSLLNGKIELESEKNKGTIFTVTIPVKLSDEVIIPKKEADITNASTVKGPTVLCIDDDPEALELLHGYLSDEGYNVITALSGEQGLKKAKKLKPLVITLDIQMPHMDGWEVINKLKSDADTQNIPVIFVSMMDNKKLGFKLGAYDYQPKPINPDSLIKSINKILCRKAETILVVDDEPEVLDLLRQILEDEDIKVQTANNGLKALESLKVVIPDLILLDLMMPEMDGFEVLKHLKKNKKWLNIPVIIITAKSLKAKEKKYLDKKVEITIAKEGMTNDVILEEITRAIKKYKT